MQIGIFGAGSIGCYVGGMLAADGKKPVLVGRPLIGEKLKNGIVLTRHDGSARLAAPGSFVFSTDPSALSNCQCVLVCVKSNDTFAAAKMLAGRLPQGALVVSLQNGIANAALLGQCLPQHTIVPGMVGFNVAQIGDNRFHCGTDGEIVIADVGGALQLATALNTAGLPAMVRRDMLEVQWGKLLLNLNNAVNALSGLPLKQQLSNAKWRKIFAMSLREALAVLKAAKIRPAKLGKVAPGLIPAILDLPDWLFLRIAASMLKIDDEARSSMAEDLEKARPPEIDFLNGEIVRLGARNGVKTPVNAAIIRAVQALFGQKPPVHPDADEVLNQM